MIGRHLLLFLSVFTLKWSRTSCNQADLETMMEKMSQDTLAFARHMEILLEFENRCSDKTLSDCDYGNYDACYSELPDPDCPGGELTLPFCGNGKDGGCSAWYDFTATTVRWIGQDNFTPNPADDYTKDAICSSRQAESYMIESSVQATEYWSRYSVNPPWYYYGSDSGVFRIYPGRGNTEEKCPNTYDPRIRPWYVAGSSGPKDIVLVLDTSGSMQQKGRLEDMKAAATRVINTLSLWDYVAVVIFNDYSYQLGDTTQLIQATTENKEKLLDLVNKLEAKGATNFYAAYETAFRILEESGRLEITSGCHKAILFLTDGEMTLGDGYRTVNDLFNLIQAEMDVYRNNDMSSPVHFTYSFGGGADETIPKQIACENDGIWTRIEDGEDLSESMGAYYKYFAYGLGDTNNNDFVAWVEPYLFATGVGLGTTASAPVYNRKVDPPILAGVVGLDFSFAAMEVALGIEGAKGREEIIRKIAQRSTANCPNLNLTKCQLESLRYYEGVDYDSAISSAIRRQERLCNECEMIPYNRAELCNYNDPDPSIGKNYPTELWNNHYYGRTDEERLCCNVGEERKGGELHGIDDNNKMCRAAGKSSDDSPGSSSENSSVVVIAGIVCGVAAFLIALEKRYGFCCGICTIIFCDEVDAPYKPSASRTSPRSSNSKTYYGGGDDCDGDGD